MQQTPIIIALVALVGAIATGYALSSLWRNRRTPGALACMGMFGCAGLYVISTLRIEPTLLSVQLSYIGAALTSPLLFVAVSEYVGLRVPGWRALRILTPIVPLGVALLTLYQHHDVFVRIASEADLASRVDLVKAARQSVLAPTTLFSYAFTLAAVGIALWRLLTARHQRREMLAIIALPAMVAVADMSYFLFGALMFGVMPTPFAMAFGMVLMALTLYDSRMFDIRPIARTALIDNLQDAMAVVDEQGRLIDYNRAATALLNDSQADLIGQPVANLLPCALLALLEHKSRTRQEVALNAGKETRWLEVDVTPLEINRRLNGHLLIARDITARKLAHEALQASREALEAANRRLEEQSITDALTGLRNRRFLFERLQEEVNRHRRSGRLLSLLVLDIDHFKRINDTHGHPAGDRAICAVAEAIRRVIRDNDIAARIGGEEFAVIAVDTHPRGPERLAERLRAAIAGISLEPAYQPPIRLSASIGVAYHRRGTCDADRLFYEADLQLYAAKNQGRNRVACATPPSDLDSLAS